MNTKIPQDNLNKFLKTLLILLTIALLVAIFRPTPSFAEYARHTPDLPNINAILYKPGSPVANLTLHNVDYIASTGDVLENEWCIEEIRRKSILFRKNSNRNFVEIYLQHPKQLRHTIETSFLGKDLKIFDALIMVAKAYEVNILMHHACITKVSPSMQPASLKSLLKQLIVSPYHTISEHPHYFVLPNKSSQHNYEQQTFFNSTFNTRQLETFYPSLMRCGTLRANGEDVRETLSRLSIATDIPILISENLYFPVFAVFHNVKFSVILEKLLYINDCTLVEYEKGIEVVR